MGRNMNYDEYETVVIDNYHINYYDELKFKCYPNRLGFVNV